MTYTIDVKAVREAATAFGLHNQIRIDVVNELDGEAQGTYSGIVDGKHSIRVLNGLKAPAASTALLHEMTHAAQFERVGAEAWPKYLEDNWDEAQQEACRRSNELAEHYALAIPCTIENESHSPSDSNTGPSDTTSSTAAPADGPRTSEVVAAEIEAIWETIRTADRCDPFASEQRKLDKLESERAALVFDEGIAELERLQREHMERETDPYGDRVMKETPGWR